MKNNYFEFIYDHLYINFSLYCKVCSEELNISEIPKDPVEEWAKQEAYHAIKLGWKSNKSKQILCPNCSSGKYV